jgi:hypothetical protein
MLSNSMQNYIISMEILESLGGRDFLVASKSKEPIILENGFQIRLARNKSTANYLHVIAKPDGTYTFTLIRATLALFKIVQRFSQVGRDQLLPLFEAETGFTPSLAQTA